MEWEAKYGNQVTASTFHNIPELAVGSHGSAVSKRNASRTDKATEEQSISNSYRCSDCRTRGNDGISNVSGETGHSEVRQQDSNSQPGYPTCAHEASGDVWFAKSLHVSAMTDDESSSPTAIVSAKKPVPAVQEAWVARDCNHFSVNNITDDIQDIDSDCYTITAESNYQAMLDEEELSKGGNSTRLEKPAYSESFVKSKDVTPEFYNPHPSAGITKQQVQHLTVQSTKAKSKTLSLEESQTRSEPAADKSSFKWNSCLLVDALQ
jgi:hypothetical protein